MTTAVDTKALYDEMRSTWEQFKGVVDTQGTERAETKAYLAKLNDRICDLEAALQKPPLGSPTEQKAERGRAEKEALFTALRYGMHNLPAEQKSLVKIVGIGDAKALALADDTVGGFLAPSEFVSEIIKGVTLISQLRTIARVRPTANRSVIVPRRTGQMAAAAISETGTRSDRTGLTYGTVEIPTHEMYAEVLVSLQSMEDAAFDLEAEVREECAEQLAVKEGAWFVNGTGVNQAEGFATNSTVLASYEFSGSAAAITADGLIKLQHAVKSDYARNGTWVFNRKTLGQIRALKDSQNRYLFQDGLSASMATLLLGHSYVELPDLADAGSNTYPVFFGDFRRAYTIVDRVQYSVQRLTERYADTGQIAIMARRRVGGQVVLPEAIKPLKCATS